MPRKVLPKVVGKVDIAVEHRGGAEPRIDLNELDVHSFLGKEALLRREIKRRIPNCCGWNRKFAPWSVAPPGYPSANGGDQRH